MKPANSKPINIKVKRLANSEIFIIDFLKGDPERPPD